MAPMLPQLFFLHFEGTSFVAEDGDGRLAGFLVGFLSQTDPDDAYVHFVGVAPEQRGSGLGRELYERFFEAAREAGRSTDPLRHVTRERELDRLPPSARVRGGSRRRGLRRSRGGQSPPPEASGLATRRYVFSASGVSSGVTSGSGAGGGGAAGGGAAAAAGGSDELPVDVVRLWASLLICS